MMPRVVVDNTIEMTEEKISDVFLVTKEFHTSTEFSQFIEKSAFNAQTPCMDMVVDYCIKTVSYTHLTLPTKRIV